MKKFLVLGLFIVLFSVNLFATPVIITGQITGLTSIPSGLLIRTDNPLPTGTCSTSTWLLVKEEDEVMVSVALLAWLNKINVSIYLESTICLGIYAVVNQIDPDN